jgi:predicted metal-dependent hydrolase
MASKEFQLDDQLMVTIYKRRGSRNLRLSIAPNGKVRVTIPAWAPYKAGLDFANSRLAWIQSQQRPVNLLSDGQQIGKAHRLSFELDVKATKPSSRVGNNRVVIKYPPAMTPGSEQAQHLAHEASVRALRAEAEQLLPQRLETLATEKGFEYSSVQIKRLKGRWGSCDHKKRIVLNLFLMQLPWNLIDYVLLHELTHTKILRHGPKFWHAMSEVLPKTQQLRKELKSHHPLLNN